jgi:[lysine-biosynthesis-protein LysW]--L-2-aminoadipate ligase
MATVGVLCTRVRVEEKQIITALAAAGVPALHLDPCRSPLPVGPVPPRPSAEEAGGVVAEVIVDRCQNRAVAASVLRLFGSGHPTVLDAGIAATGDRLAVAAALAGAGVPRPETRLVCSEESALAALEEIGYPSVVLPLMPGTPDIVLYDRDTAEAVLEHRHVLGNQADALGLMQQGLSLATDRTTVVVINGEAIAIGQTAAAVTTVSRAILDLAEAAAQALDAAVIGVEIAQTAAGPVVWDTQPVPEFRDMLTVSDISVAEALAQCIMARATINNRVAENGSASTRIARLKASAAIGREVTAHVALLA